MAKDNDNISSVFDYVARVKEITDKLRVEDDDIMLFRGHSNKDYKLIPSLFRKGNEVCKSNEKIREREAESIRIIETVYPRELAGMSTLDKLVMLQHYEFPTRLLDFSFNPLVGLFFAANSHEDKNGTVIICRVPKDDVMPFDSGIVKALSSLAVMPNDLKKELSGYDSECLSSALSEIMSLSCNFFAIKESSDKKSSNKKLLELAIKIKNFMSHDAETKPDFFTPVFVKSKQLNPRIVAQKGAFLLFGLNNEFPENIQREEIIIPMEHKADIMQELEQFGIDNSIMFPGFEHFLKYLCDKMRRGE